MSVTRKMLITLAGALGLATALVYPHSAAAVSLRQNTVIDGDTITLGHVFQGLAHDSERVLGPAPRPGQDMVLNARTLLRIAMALDIPWRPQTATESVVLTRAATVIGKDRIESAVLASLKDKAALTGPFSLSYNGETPEIVMPMGSDPSVNVKAISYDAQSGAFTATLASKDNAGKTHEKSVTGSVTRMARVPVLTRTLNAGTIIAASDIDFIEIPEKSVQHDTVLEPSELIGLQPRRVVTAGQPVKAAQIAPPKIIARGDIVTMVFREGPLQLTAQGKALEDGTTGDRIRVSNTASSKVILAQITGNREVTVMTE